MKITKNLILLLLMALITQLTVPFALAGQLAGQLVETFPQAGEALISTEVDVGYWDIWRHSDGVTWQWTGKPGDAKIYNEFEINPPAEVSGYNNVRFAMGAGISKNDFMVAGGWHGFNPDTEGWEKFQFERLEKVPDNYRKTGEKEVTFTLSPEEYAEIITKQDQGEQVKGLRWYLPVTIKWYGVPVPCPDFEVKTLIAGTDKTEPGEPYTGTVTYRLKDTAEGPKEAILHMIHNDFGLKTPEGETIHNKILTFQPGEEKTFNFAWTGQNSDSKLRAEVWPTEPRDIPKEDRDADPGDNIKEVTVRRDAKVNLSVQIVKYPAKSRGGQPVHIEAIVKSDTDDLIHTNIEWKVNGERHHYSDDLIFRGEREAKITFTMPEKNAVVEVVVNQHNDRPVEENIADNRDGKTVIFEPDKPDKSASDDEGTFKLEIIAPNEIPIQKFGDRKPFSYKIKFTWTFTQTCEYDEDGGSADCGPPVPDPKNVRLTVDTQGYFSKQYSNVTKQPFEFIHNHDVYTENFYADVTEGAAECLHSSKTSSTTRWTFTKIFEYTYPGKTPASYGVFGQDTNTIIKADAVMENSKKPWEEKKYSNAEKKVLTGALIIPEYMLNLIK